MQIAILISEIIASAHVIYSFVVESDFVDRNIFDSFSSSLALPSHS